jgi:hypothetical protein
MQLAYLSTDELNRELVRGWAGRQGLGVTCPSRVDRAPEESYDAVLLDLDHLPANGLAELLDRLAATRRYCLVAAHGYGTARIDLGGRPLAVHERLRPGVLRDLARAARSAAPEHVVEESVELTWVDLA